MNPALAHSHATDAQPDMQADFRQLRHQTKNALTRILAQVSACLPAQGPAQRVAADLERRILLTAEISDALFGLTRAPAKLEQRLFSLCSSVIELYADPDQELTLRCSVQHTVRPALDTVILRVAHELVGNAVKHGMHMRLLGRIEVRLELIPAAPCSRWSMTAGAAARIRSSARACKWPRCWPRNPAARSRSAATATPRRRRSGCPCNDPPRGPWQRPRAGARAVRLRLGLAAAHAHSCARADLDARAPLER